MPFEAHWQHRCLYKRFFGTVTGREFLLSVLHTHNDPRYEDLSYSVNDLTDARIAALSPQDMSLVTERTIGVAFSQCNWKLRIAIITGDAQAMAMARRFAEETPHETHVFESRAHANEWLPPMYHLKLEPALVHPAWMANAAAGAPTHLRH
ncbi:hypothetical protein [Hydrogenophaga soli]|nr:hypothetical protein [Burkholderiaceae bacterium]